MFRELRRKEKQLSEESVLEIIKGGEHGILSTCGEDGYPYGVPINYVLVDDCIYFHCAMEGHKLDNINYNNKVSLCIIGEHEVIPEKFSTMYESVVIFGKASDVVEMEERKKILMKLIERFSPKFLDKGSKYIEGAWEKTKIIKIDIEDMKGKCSNR